MGPMYFLVHSIFCGLLCWYIAQKKGVPTICWTLFGCLMGVFAVLWMLVKKWEPFECPSCGEPIPESYISVGRCPECKTKFKVANGDIWVVKQVSHR